MGKLIKKIGNRIYKLNKKELFFIFLIVEIPFLLIFYPGLMIRDSGESIAQLYGYKTTSSYLTNTPNNVLSNHHMIVFTYLMGGVIKFGDLIGSQNFGFFVYALIQTLIINSILIYVLTTIKEDFTEKTYNILFIFYLLFPIFIIWKITMAKDSLYSVFILLFTVFEYKIINSKFQCLKDKKFFIQYCICIILCVFTKQQCSYIMLLLSMFLFVFFKRNSMKAILPLAIASIFYLTIFTNFILPACNISKSGKQEMMGFMFQQTARYVVDNEQEITVEEKQVINCVLPYDELTTLYNENKQDPVKFKFNQNATNEEIIDYVEVWFSMLFKHPESYFAATATNIDGFFLNRDEPEIFPKLIEETTLYSEFDLINLSNTFDGRYLIRDIINKISNIPILTMAFRPCTYTWITIALFIIGLTKNNISLLICLIPGLLSIGIFIVSPVVHIRYSLPLIYTTPFLISICFNKKRIM